MSVLSHAARHDQGHDVAPVGSSCISPTQYLAEIWPRLQPHIRDAIQSLVEADLVTSRLKRGTSKQNEEGGE
jgi:hypothetical protein